MGLQWICMLLAQSPVKMREASTLNRLFTPIFETLLHREDEVVLAALRVLAQIMEGSAAIEDKGDAYDEDGKSLFTEVTHRLLNLFAADRNMLEEKGRLLIRQLCGHLDPRHLYVTVARAIHQQGDLDLAQQLVQTFSWILLTAKETKTLREELLKSPELLEPPSAPRRRQADTFTSAAATFNSNSVSPQLVPQKAPEASLFLELLVPWFHNPVSALALCLWAQQYELALRSQRGSLNSSRRSTS